MKRLGLLVLGMHRSGTSALSGLLVHLGARGPSTLMGGDPHNPTGYWESRAFNEFHERLLLSAGSSWDAWTRVDVLNGGTEHASQIPVREEFRQLLAQEFGNAPLFVMKDPRVCRFAPFWLRELEANGVEPRAVIMLRSPLEVAASLAARDRLEPERSLLMWLRHVLDAEFETRGVARSFVVYDDLLRDWKQVAERIAADLDIELTPPDDAAQSVDAFLLPALRHHDVGLDQLDPVAPLSPWLTRTFSALESLARNDATARPNAERILDDVRRELDAAGAIFGDFAERERQRLRELVETIDQGLELARVGLRQGGAELEQQGDLKSRLSALGAEARGLQVNLARVAAECADLRKQTVALEEERRAATADASRLAGELRAMRSRAAAMEERTEMLTRDLSGARHQVDAMLASLSWRFTAPLRVAFGMLRSVVRRDASGPE